MDLKVKFTVFYQIDWFLGIILKISTNILILVHLTQLK